MIDSNRKGAFSYVTPAIKQQLSFNSPAFDKLEKVNYSDIVAGFDFDLLVLIHYHKRNIYADIDRYKRRESMNNMELRQQRELWKTDFVFAIEKPTNDPAAIAVLQNYAKCGQTYRVKTDIQ